MSGKRRKAFLVTAALVGGTMLMTACQDKDQATGSGAESGSASASSTTAGDKNTGSGKEADTNTGKGSGTTGGGSGSGSGSDSDSGSDSGSGVDVGNGKRVPVEQGCGANDISWSTRSESQGGGYILIIAKAKSGITCTLPAELPTVAFGSDGTEAGPAEQSVGEAIKLSGNTAAYAGVNPKTTGTDGGKELNSIIVGVGDEDPGPVSLRVGTITVDKPIVTNWHTAPTDAVPFS